MMCEFDQGACREPAVAHHDVSRLGCAFRISLCEWHDLLRPAAYYDRYGLVLERSVVTPAPSPDTVRAARRVLDSMRAQPLPADVQAWAARLAEDVKDADD